jgi:hypothetical protein
MRINQLLIINDIANLNQLLDPQKDCIYQLQILAKP